MHLGITDAEIESVWMTPEGFISPWFKWASTEPNGRTGDAVSTQDCVRRHVNTGRWEDINCHNNNLRYYCEGNTRAQLQGL